MRGRGVVWLERLCRWGLAGIFLAAAFPKIMDPSGFAADISHYALVPDAVVNVMAVVLPWVEAVMGLALLSGFAAEGAGLLAGVLLAVFLAALGQAWARGLDIECGCFGHSQARGNVAVAFLRDSAFLALAAAAVWLRSRRLRASR